MYYYTIIHEEFLDDLIYNDYEVREMSVLFTRMPLFFQEERKNVRVISEQGTLIFLTLSNISRETTISNKLT